MADAAVCLDTSVLVAYLKGKEPGAAAALKAIQQHECWGYSHYRL